MRSRVRLLAAAALFALALPAISKDDDLLPKGVPFQGNSSAPPPGAAHRGAAPVVPAVVAPPVPKADAPTQAPAPHGPRVSEAGVSKRDPARGRLVISDEGGSGKKRASKKSAAQRAAIAEARKAYREQQAGSGPRNQLESNLSQSGPQTSQPNGMQNSAQNSNMQNSRPNSSQNGQQGSQQNPNQGQSTHGNRRSR